MPPGMTYLPLTSIVVSAERPWPMVATFSSSISTSAWYVSPAVTIVAPLMSVRITQPPCVRTGDERSETAHQSPIPLTNHIIRPHIGHLEPGAGHITLRRVIGQRGRVDLLAPPAPCLAQARGDQRGMQPAPAMLVAGAVVMKLGKPIGDEERPARD